MSSSRDRTAARVNRIALNDETALFECVMDTLDRRRLLRINPDQERPARMQVIQQPVQRLLKGPERAAPPIHQRDIVLLRRPATIGGRCRMNVTAVMHIQHELNGLGTRDEDLILCGASRKRDHRLNDAIARARRR